MAKALLYVVPENAEQMTAYRYSLLKKYAKKEGLIIVDSPATGLWSGSSKTWIGAQDLVVLQKDK